MRPKRSPVKLSMLVRKTFPLFSMLMRRRLWVLALGLLLVMISRAAGLALPFSMRFLVDTVIGARQVQWLAPLLLGILAANVIQAVTVYALTQLFAKEGVNLVFELRCKLYEHLIRLPVSFHDVNKSGALQSRIISDVDGVRNLFSVGIVQFLGSIIAAIYGVIYLLLISGRLTFMALCGVTIYGAIAKTQMKNRRPLYTELMEVRQEVSGRLTESVSGIRVVKAYQAEAQQARRFEKHFNRLSESVYRTTSLNSLIGAVNTLVLALITLAITYAASREILAGSLTVGGFITFNALLLYLIGPAQQFAALTGSLGDALTALERTQDLLQERTEHDNPRRQCHLNHVYGMIRFEGVSFAYESSKRVLNDISFEAAPDTVTALVGPSGAGKTTLINLVAGFYEAGEGIISVDGVDLSTVRLDSYRSRLGFVFQDVFLFDGTIRENVAFARPTASEAEILRACKIAHVDDFAINMPDGYDTLVGERGIRLSGGQRQRISIARAIVAEARILILDEATSNLDSEAEASIQEAMAYLLRGRTTFVIAHRLSTVNKADQILVIEGGRITERGTHHELYEARGRYFDFWNRQQTPVDTFGVPRSQSAKHGSTPTSKETQADTLV